ncbi:MAG TPA: protein kinase [Verrucomicrobiae bacterium]
MRHAEHAYKVALLSTAVVPEHELLRPIASGAYGQVWLACNRLGAYRAVKIVHRVNFDHERPFEREFAGIKAFEPVSRSHEGLVDLLQVGRDDTAGYFYYVMELADDARARGSDGVSECWSDEKTGPSQPCSTPVHPFSGLPLRDLNAYHPRTLAADLKLRGRIPLEECIRIGLSLTEALAHLHGQGLVHRDVKPSNIIFVGGMPKLADVGLVAGVGEARSFVGTEGFIPPEGPGTPQADIYSLGIVLYELSTGKSHQEFPEPPPDLAAWPDHSRWLEFNAILLKACQADWRERYRTAQQMRDELVLLQRGESVRAKRVTQSRWALAKKLAVAAVALACLVLPLRLLRASKPAYTPNPEALRLYKHGRWHYSRLTPEAHAKALESLWQAVRLDPKFVQPYGELTALYTWYLLPGPQSEQIRLQKTKEIAERALATDPSAAEGHTALSWCRFLERDWRGAEQEIQRAINLNPRMPIAHDVYSFYLSMLGRTDEARREGQRAEEFEEPDSARVTSIIAAWPYMAERRFDLAIAQLQRVLELDPNFTYGHSFLGDCYDAQSNYVAAIEEFKTFALLVGQDRDRVAESYGALRRAYGTQGEAGYLRKWVELIQADQKLPEEQQMFLEMDIVGYYARLGETEKALTELETHFEEPQVWHQIKFKAMYDPLHGEPRFKALLERAGLKN